MQPPPMCEGTSSPQTLSGSRSALLRVLGVMPGRGAEGFCGWSGARRDRGSEREDCELVSRLSLSAV